MRAARIWEPWRSLWAADRLEAPRTGLKASVPEVNRQACEQIGDQRGDGGVVLGGQFAGLAIEVVVNRYGDVFGLAHGRVGAWASLLLWLRAGIFLRKAKLCWVCGLGQGGLTVKSSCYPRSENKDLDTRPSSGSPTTMSRGRYWRCRSPRTFWPRIFDQ